MPRGEDIGRTFYFDDDKTPVAVCRYLRLVECSLCRPRKRSIVCARGNEIRIVVRLEARVLRGVWE